MALVLHGASTFEAIKVCLPLSACPVGIPLSVLLVGAVVCVAFGALVSRSVRDCAAPAPVPVPTRIAVLPSGWTISVPA